MIKVFISRSYFKKAIHPKRKKERREKIQLNWKKIYNRRSSTKLKGGGFKKINTVDKLLANYSYREKDYKLPVSEIDQPTL